MDRPFWRFLSVVALLAIGAAASDGASAQSSSGLRADAQVQGDMNADASCGATASNRIATSDGYSGGGSTRVVVQGSINASARCGQKAETVVGATSRSGDTNILGDLNNMGGTQEITGNTDVIGTVTTAPNAEVRLGGCGSTTVAGDVYVADGELEIGCVCAARRNGRCCVTFHNSLCVLSQMPPGKHGCPPGYVYSAGLCRLYSDRAHSYGW